MKHDDTAAAGTAVAEEEEAGGFAGRSMESHPTRPQTHDVAKLDEIRELGFRHELTKDGHIAYEILGDGRVPRAGKGFETIEALVAAVREEVKASGLTENVKFGGIDEEGETDEETLNDDIDRDLGIEDDEDELEPGQSLVKETVKGPRLPGVYEIADEQLATAAGNFKSANNAWAEAGKERKNALDALKAVAHMKEDLFVDDPENTGAKICRVGGMVVRLLETTKEKVEVDDIGVDD